MCALWLFRVTAPIVGLRKSYFNLLIRLIRQSNLFDSAYYLERNDDVYQGRHLPLRHYARYGDREGRHPLAVFDPKYYRSKIKDRTKSVNSLLHYCYVGRHLRISPSPWFDVSFYLAENKDVARSGMDPLYHYLNWGGLEGRSPCRQFDGSFYLATYADVTESRINPLLHYLHFGLFEKRLPRPETATQSNIPVPPLRLVTPTDECWLSLRRRNNNNQATVDVIVPVYMGQIETLCCLHSILAANDSTPYELIVINDASPDIELINKVKLLAATGLFTLITNKTNQGFVNTVNTGMALHQDRDVVLVNSDTELYNNWLERLILAAYNETKTGTVTPLSNNATICSYPRFLHDNPYPLEMDYAELDNLAAITNSGKTVKTPTGVGFCMFIKRTCLNEVGLFDEKLFGKGYGEENDFCQRAAQYNWQNIIATDVFVHHWGATSFQGEKAKRVELALKILDKQHPRYHKEVTDFIHNDPLAPARARLDWARLQHMKRKKNILIISHNRSGGTERHIQEDIQRFQNYGHGVFLLRPWSGKPSHVVFSHPQIKVLPNLAPIDLHDHDSLQHTITELGISEVHTHSFVDLIPTAAYLFTQLFKTMTLYWEANIHDYKVICPRINLINHNGYYCGEPDDMSCNRCLTSNGSDFNVTDIGSWREMHNQALQTANKVLVPDRDVSERLSRYFPQAYFTISPHEENIVVTSKFSHYAVQQQEKLRVVIIGAIGKMKGYKVVLSCARLAQKTQLPIQFIVMGYSMNDQKLKDAGVEVSGKYQEHQALNILHDQKPHLIWIPSLWPETFCYTLSIALATDLPIMAFDIGAVATRLRATKRDQLLMPLDYATMPKEILITILNSFSIDANNAL